MMPLEDDFLVPRAAPIRMQNSVTSFYTTTPVSCTRTVGWKRFPLRTIIRSVYTTTMSQYIWCEGIGGFNVVENGLLVQPLYIGNFMKMQRHISFGFVRFFCHVCVDSCVCVMQHGDVDLDNDKQINGLLFEIEIAIISGIDTAQPVNLFANCF